MSSLNEENEDIYGAFSRTHGLLMLIEIEEHSVLLKGMLNKILPQIVSDNSID